MSELWQQARLIPTSGINGAQEQERRATSALLAVMGAVKEYGRSLTKALGAPAGEIETFIEVELDLDGKKVIRLFTNEGVVVAGSRRPRAGFWRCSG